MGSSQLHADTDTVVRAIKDSVAIEKVETPHGDVYTKALYAPPEPKLAPHITVRSLTGLVDYLNRSIDTKARKDTFVHVVTETAIHVHSSIDGERDLRWTPLAVNADLPVNRLLEEEDVSQTEAIIALSSCFKQNEDRDDLIRILSSIVIQDEVGLEDSGLSQQITTRSGVDSNRESMKASYDLIPFRTFAEIEQPSSPFVARLGRSGKNVEISLFLADGGAWASAARVSIKRFLDDNLAAGIPVLA
jgi:hypothetical protein